MYDQYLLGWNCKQWGYAKNYYVSCTGEQPKEEYADMMKILKFWQNKRNDEPCETNIYGVNQEIDYMWALHSMSNAIKHFHMKLY